MHPQDVPAFVPGTSILGGAACGLSYEGALRDAAAHDDTLRRRDAGRARPVAPPQHQQRRPVPDDAQRGTEPAT